MNSKNITLKQATTNVLKSQEFKHLVDMDYQLLAMSEPFIKWFNFGSNVNYHGLDFVQELKKIYKYKNELPISFTYNALIEKQGAPVLSVVKHSQGVFRFKQEALFLENEQTVICTSFIAEEQSIDRHLVDVIDTRYGAQFIKIDNIFKLNLTKLEEKICCLLLLCGYSLLEIAQRLNYSRAYIKRIIADKLCPKFAVVNESSRLLVEKLIASNFCYYVPKELMYSSDPQILQVNDIGIQLNGVTQQIVDLLLLNFTQQEIANQLNYSRSMIAKTINEKIYKPLQINSANQLMTMLRN